MEARAPAQDLMDLDDTGCKVDVRGLLTDWADQPPHTARPVMEATEIKKARREFSTEEMETLTDWCQAAEQENKLSGSAAFVDFECLFPNHSWRAYESKWRQGKRPPRRDLEPSYDHPFPNYNLASRQIRPLMERTGETANATPPPPPHHESDNLTYTDFRADVLKNLLRGLQLATVADLEAFLKQDWVTEAYLEYHLDCLGPTRESDKEFLERNAKLPSVGAGRSHQQWKIDRASAVIRTAQSKYLEEHPDKSLWVADDHDVRFIVRLVKAGTAPGRPWSVQAEGADSDWERKLAHRGFQLMEWLRWVYKLSTGTARESRRAQNRKNQWLAFFQNLEGARNVSGLQPIQWSRQSSRPPSSHGRALDNTGPGSSPDLTAEPSMPQRSDDCVGVAQTTSCASDIQVDPSIPIDATVSVPRALAIPAEELDRRLQAMAGLRDVPSTASTHEAMIRGLDMGPPQYEVKRSRTRNQEKGIFWLTEEAYMVYQKQRDRRLNSWGLNADAVGTCVLVPEQWAEVEPSLILQESTQEQLLEDASGQERLCLSIGDVNVSWARACAWFESWPEHPRRGVDLDQFLVGPEGQWPEMHGSHRCHQGLCIQPSHIVYETKGENLSRQGCHSAARSSRRYGVPIRQHCERHDPPCLLQHAALTTAEAICIQLFVLRLALDLPLGDPWTKPADHPELFTTFETKLPLTMPAAAVCVDPGTLVEPPLWPDSDVLERFTIRCAFCPAAQRQWSQITSYWSHIKIKHSGLSKKDRLQEVRRSAHEYLGWIDARGLDYEKKNAPTSQKLREAQAPDFSWDTFENWRLHQDRLNERTVERVRK